MAAADAEVLKECRIDRERYRIIGISVLVTWLFATLAWGYFFSTVVNDEIVVAGLALFFGFAILSIDRSLIAAMGVRVPPPARKESLGSPFLFSSNSVRFFLLTSTGCKGKLHLPIHLLNKVIAPFKQNTPPDLSRTLVHQKHKQDEHKF